MCPACVGSAAMIAIGLVPTGGVAAFAARLFRWGRRTKVNSLGEPERKEK